MITTSLKSTVKKYPIPAAVTGAFIISLVVTAAYFVGAIPIVPKTLPLFSKMVTFSALLFAISVASWFFSTLT
jgi:hypothetical protein